MEEAFTVTPIAHIRTDFKEKFGIPRQSGRVMSLVGKIIFEPAYRNRDALRGMEGFSHLWLLFDFSEAHRKGFSPTVRPPRLGGNTRMGVFATRSPFRPNPIGLSCVKFVGIEDDPVEGPVILVSGADLLDGTPILDIKPYLPSADCRPDAVGGFADDKTNYHLEVSFPQELLDRLPQEKRETVRALLAEDPRPSYQDDPDRVYGMLFAGYNVRFSVEKGLLTVTDVELP